MKKFMLILIVGIAITAAFRTVMKNRESFKAINVDSENVAIKGFDTVAFFTAQKAVEGNAQYSLLWNGAKWYFSSAENLEKFKAEPEQFAPQFGGFCSWAVSKGYTADGDPQTWKIVDGKLYLNYNQKVKQNWEKEQEKNIKEAEKNWLEFKTKKPEHKG